MVTPRAFFSVAALFALLSAASGTVHTDTPVVNGGLVRAEVAAADSTLGATAEVQIDGSGRVSNSDSVEAQALLEGGLQADSGTEEVQHDGGAAHERLVRAAARARMTQRTTRATATAANLIFSFGGKAFQTAKDVVNLADLGCPTTFGREFAVYVEARFDLLDSWSRVFDFGNGSPSDNLLFTHAGTTNMAYWEHYQGTQSSVAHKAGAWEAGVVAQMLVTIRSDGYMRMWKNGVLIASKVGRPLNLVKRTKLLVGGSMWSGDAPTRGAIYNMHIFNADVTWEALPKLIPFGFASKGGSWGVDFYKPSSNWYSMPVMDGLRPGFSMSMPTMNFVNGYNVWSNIPAAERVGNKWRNDYSTRGQAIVHMDLGGTHTFCSPSDDGAKVFVDGSMVVNNDGLHGWRDKCAHITMARGYHHVMVDFYEHGGWHGFKLDWAAPGVPRQLLPQTHVLSGRVWAVEVYHNNGAGCDAPTGLAGLVPDIVTVAHTINADSTTSGWTEVPAMTRGQFNQHFYILAQAILQIKATGSYRFYIYADDGLELLIDEKRIIHDGGCHGPSEKSAAVTLHPGFHHVRVRYAQREGPWALKIHIKEPGGAKQLLDPSKFPNA